MTDFTAPARAEAEEARTADLSDFLFEAESLQAQCAAKEARASNLRARAAAMIEEASNLELEALSLWHQAAQLEEKANG